MPTLVISGPEKAGKSTLVNAIASEWWDRGGSSVKVRHWTNNGRLDARDTRNMWALLEDLTLNEDPTNLCIWDRSWVCEAIYNSLLERSGDLQIDSMLGEWLYGRAVQSMGASVIVVPERVRDTLIYRDSEDHTIDPNLEKEAYKAYAERYGLLLLENDYTIENLDYNVQLLLDLLSEESVRPMPPVYCGPKDAKVVLVEERDNRNPDLGEWLPFSDRHGFLFADTIGPRALQFGWATARTFPPKVLRGADTLVTIGPDATRWCQFYVNHPNVLSTGVGLLIEPSRQRNIEAMKQVGVL